jgi:hypothetical protein
MKQIYLNWISSNYGIREKCYRKCVEATTEMCLKFPELSRVRGHVREWIGDSKPQPHWWCVDKEGEIIDPTNKQFFGPLDYIPWNEGTPEPTGKCPNCSGYSYNYSVCCSDKCSEEYKNYILGK